MDKNMNDMAIVQTSINLARNMELRVVAEGVETKESLDRLIDMECEMAQGYYLCKPVPAEEIPDKIKKLNATGYRLPAARHNEKSEFPMN
jgi:EAL domain-containing protein (putative c-di-GMP-specific phosphodiesterase class I)